MTDMGRGLNLPCRCHGTNDSQVAHSGVSQLPPDPRVGLFFCGDQPLHHRSQLSELSYGGLPYASHRAHRLASDQTCVDLDQTNLSGLIPTQY